MRGERDQRLPDPKKIAGMVRESLGYLGCRGSAVHLGPPGARDVANAAGTAHLADANALAIGLSRYSHIRLLPDVRDASDVAAGLTDPALAGYPPANVRTLLDVEATRAAISQAGDRSAELAALPRLSDQFPIIRPCLGVSF